MGSSVRVEQQGAQSAGADKAESRQERCRSPTVPGKRLGTSRIEAGINDKHGDRGIYTIIMRATQCDCGFLEAKASIQSANSKERAIVLSLCAHRGSKVVFGVELVDWCFVQFTARRVGSLVVSRFQADAQVSQSDH